MKSLHLIYGVGKFLKFLYINATYDILTSLLNRKPRSGRYLFPVALSSLTQNPSGHWKVSSTYSKSLLYSQIAICNCCSTASIIYRVTVTSPINNSLVPVPANGRQSITSRISIPRCNRRDLHATSAHSGTPLNNTTKLTKLGQNTYGSPPLGCTSP